MCERRNSPCIKLGIVGLLVALVIQGGWQPALAGSSWFSKARTVTKKADGTSGPARAGATDGISALAEGDSTDAADPAAAGDSTTTVFDLVISLYNAPSGDDDPDNDTGTEDQTNYEEIVRFWADAVCEQSNQALKLGKVRIFRNGIQSSLADVVWNESEWPRASPSGFGRSGKRITFGDIFPDGIGFPDGTTADFDYLDPANHEDGGYTLGHEFGHYILGLYDEYVGSDPDEDRIYFPQVGDDPVSPSIMNSQWNATPGGDFEWLNHSTEDNYEANTAQGRSYGASGWEVLIQEISNDPKDGDRATLSQRVRYTALVGEEPTAADNWVKEELPGAQADCRSELEIVWMQDDIEIQIVIDRSDSMDGDPLTNAKEAAKTLVDEVEDGKTALGVVSFNDTADQSQPIVAIPDPPGSTKTDIKDVINDLSSSGLTAMFDAADLALVNLQSYASTNGTDAAQLVFLLSDGMDNSSTETQETVTSAYQSGDVPLITFAYGDFAPEGVLRELAEDTGGLFRASPTDLAELQSAFLAAKAALTSSAGVLQESDTVPGNGSESFGFAVDSTLAELSIFANYVGSAGDISFSLTGPGGNTGVGFACTEVSGSTSCGAVVGASTVASQGTGPWFLEADNNTGSAIEVNVDILATPLPVRTYDLVVDSLAGTSVEYPDPIIVTATISEDLPITGVLIAATITDPGGIVDVLELVDTGENGDGIAEDGTYSAIVDYDENGVYSIDVTIDNGAFSARYTTEAFQPAHAPSANTAGELPPAPVLPAINEDFTRTASVQLVVSGVQGDDHPDIAPGTAVAPDNADVPGRIDFAGDPDVFTVPTAGFDFLTFRVTGLALGMEPRLRILAEDGSTELLSATLDDLVAGASYLALAVAVGSNAELHAEVTHAETETGTYQFSAGSRIFSDPPLFELDIKPDTTENPVNPSSKGKIPAVVVGSSVYDVMDIDPSTLALGPDGAPGSHPQGGVYNEFTGDALVDYLNHYPTALSGIAAGDDEACLSGEVGGIPFTACDAIKTVPDKSDGAGTSTRNSSIERERRNRTIRGDAEQTEKKEIDD